MENWPLFPTILELTLSNLSALNTDLLINEGAVACPQFQMKSGDFAEGWKQKLLNIGRDDRGQANTYFNQVLRRL